MQVAADRTAETSDGDTFVPNNAFYAMSATVLSVAPFSLNGTDDNSTSTSTGLYSFLFNEVLCNSSLVHPGCAMFAMNFNAEYNMDVSLYFYQVHSEIYLCVQKITLFHCFVIHLKYMLLINNN